MGILIATGATAKAVEPLWTRITIPISKLLCFGITCAMEILSVLIAALLWQHLRPHIDNERMSFITLDGADIGTLLPVGSYEEIPTPSDHSDDSYMRDCLIPQKAFSTALNTKLLEMPKPNGTPQRSLSPR